MDKQDMVLERVHKLRTCEDITKRAEQENRELTPEEQKDCTVLIADAERIDKDIKAIEKSEEVAQSVREAVKCLAKPEKRLAPAIEPGSGGSVEAREIEVPGIRYSARKGFKSDASAYKSGMWARAMLFGDQRAKRWCAEHIESRFMNTTTNTAGGALVPDEMSQVIIDLREQYGAFRRNAKVEPMGRDTLTILRKTSGPTGYWVGEGIAITESQSALETFQLTAKKLGVLVGFSSELAEDAIIDLAGNLASDIAYEFAYKEDQAGFLGDGTNTYGGVVGLNVRLLAATAGWYRATLDQFAEITVADLQGVQALLPEKARVKGNCKWYCSSVADALVFGNLTAAGGGNTIPTLESGRVQRSYMGYPIEICQSMPSGAATDYTNLIMLAFGDLSMAATIGDRRNIELAVSTEYRFAEDQIAIKGTERVDIVVHDVGDTSVAGPVVGLVGAA